MYLTRMELDTGNRKTLYALNHLENLHGAIEEAYDKYGKTEKKRKLWRIDKLYGKTYLLLLSEDEPDLSNAVKKFGFVNKGFQTKDYSPLLDRVTDGSEWHFRLTAYPAIAKKVEDKSRGQILPHITQQYQKQWLLDRVEKLGFVINFDSKVDDYNLSVIRSKTYSFVKGKERRKVSFLSVTYEGTLTVTNAEVFRDTLVNGIGKEKAYGQGMLTIVRG